VAVELILPAGVQRPDEGERGMIVNETELSDAVVEQAVETYFEEYASLLGVSSSTTFSTYAHEGSLLARSKFRTPANVIDEVVLARDMAERDDDVAACLGAMLAIAFGEGMQNTHEDEMTVSIFDEIARNADLDSVLMELYRELLIASSVTSVSLFTSEQFTFRPPAGERQRTRPIVAPLIGVLPAELIRVIDSDIVNTGTLAYKPPTWQQETWLAEFFSPDTTPARKAEMRRQDPVLTRMLIERLQTQDDPGTFMAEESMDANFGQALYRLNPRMVARTTFAKGAAKYPRPLLTRNFGLLEAKRLLNLMDYALLQGGSNFLVVAKKGSDLRPAMPEELRNLRDTVRRSSATGVLVGDHRLSIEIITPDLNELLNPAKRRLLGRKIAMALLRLPEIAEAAAGAGQAVLADVEMLSRVIASDRRLVKRHVENRVYAEAAKRNDLIRGAASIWFPKIILQGSQYFTDLVLKLRDRGDIPRKFAVEAGGFNYEAAVQQRKREKAAGDDRVMTPAAVPFSSPNAGPQDNNQGRPPGSSPNNGSGAPGTQRTPPARARPARTITRNSGETVRAIVGEDGAVRIGELTHAILEQYSDSEQVGRITTFERAALEAIGAGDYQARREGPLTIVPVNEDHELVDYKAIRLAAGLSMIVGARPDDDAVIARALCFRAPEFSALDAQETAMRWGFATDALYEEPIAREPRPEPEPEEEQAAAPVPIIHLHTGERTRRIVTRDDDGNIVSIDDAPVE
jgi:hypothetical protein